MRTFYFPEPFDRNNPGFSPAAEMATQALQLRVAREAWKAVSFPEAWEPFCGRSVVDT